MLIAAWENEQAEIEKKEKEVRTIFAASLLFNLRCRQKVSYVSSGHSSMTVRGEWHPPNALFGAYCLHCNGKQYKGVVLSEIVHTLEQFTMAPGQCEEYMNEVKLFEEVPVYFTQ